MFCKYCGSPVDRKTMLCTNCGKPQGSLKGGTSFRDMVEQTIGTSSEERKEAPAPAVEYTAPVIEVPARSSKTGLLGLILGLLSLAISILSLVLILGSRARFAETEKNLTERVESLQQAIAAGSPEDEASAAEESWLTEEEWEARWQKFDETLSRLESQADQESAAEPEEPEASAELEEESEEESAEEPADEAATAVPKVLSSSEAALNLAEGETAVFYVQLDQPATVIWEKYDVMTGAWGVRETNGEDTTVEGPDYADRYSMTIINVTDWDNGSYRCRIVSLEDPSVLYEQVEFELTVAAGQE